MAGFEFVRSLLGGTTEMNVHTAIAEAAVTRGDAVEIGTDHTEVLPADADSKGILGVALNTAAIGAEVKYIPATPWNVFKVVSVTATPYVDATHRHTVGDIAGLTGAQSITPGTAGDAQVVILGLADGASDNTADNEIEVVICNNQFLAISGAVPA